ncbi:MAG: glycosyltransferase family 39 protein, partial [Elusimicrobiota bacterium]|nr:glycosyltransferase family 39 protein [Elusimicrobiota bacterium]
MNKAGFKYEENKELYIVFFAVLIIRLLIAVLMWPGADEAYYYLYTLNPALSYFDHPPMVALAGGLIPALLGWVTPLALRLGPIILFSAAVVYFYKVAAYFLAPRARKMAAVLFMTVPMFFISGTVLLPDAPLILFWVMGIYYFLRAQQRNTTADWVLFGAAAGFALLSKYTGGLLYIGALIYMLSLKRKRKILLSYRPWLSVVIGLAIFSPVIIWNINNSFISFS